MLSVILIWIYMFLTTFPVGYGMLCAVTRFIPYRLRHMDSYLVCGLACVTVYAQLVSLFGGVGTIANLILCAASLFAAWRYRGRLGSTVREAWDHIRENRLGERGKMFCILFLFLLFAYGTSRGIIHYDTSLYHAQSIRWIEEYGAVKGLGNLHCRLAYNSASFALSALYSMAFLGGQSYHCGAGWLALLVAKVCMEIVDALRVGRLRTSDFARVMGIYYLVNIFDEMISPASDYFMVLIAFYIVIRWLELLEQEVAEAFPYAMLCVLGVFLMTVKLSAALILLPVIQPAYRLLTKKRWKETAFYLIAGIVTAVSFLARNVVLSGWLVYPFTQIDLFDAAWKIPRGVADYDAREIQVWGRGYADVSRYDIPAGQWLPDWFRGLAGSDKALVALSAVSVCVLLVYCVGMLCRLWRGRLEYLPVQMTMAASFLFWLCTSPLIRYGCVYVYLTFAVILGGIYDELLGALEKRAPSADAGRSDAMYAQGEDSRAKRDDQGMPSAGAGRTETMGVRALRLCSVAAVLLVLAYKGLALGREMAASYVNDYWIAQKDYVSYAVSSYEIQGVTFYCPVEGDQTGYDAFPSAPVRTEVEFLGDGIRDGFAAAK